MALISGFLLTKLLTVGIVILTGLYVYLRTFVYNYWKKRSVAYMEPTIPTGNVMKVLRGKVCMGELYIEAYAKMKKHRYFGMYTFYKPMLLIAEPDLIKFVCTTGYSYFHDRGLYCNEKIDPLSGQLFLVSGTKWRNLRMKLTPAFTSGKMKQMFVTVAEIGDRLTEYLKPKAERREVIEMKELFVRFGVDVIMSVGFGISCNSLDDPWNEFRYWAQKSVEPRPFWNTMAFLGPKIMDLFSIPFSEKGVTDFFTTTFRTTLKYRDAYNIVRPDFMNVIMQLIKRGYVDGDNDEDTLRISDTPQGKITELEGAAQAFIFILGGFETTSSTITNCLYELARNQEIQDKVMKDIDAGIEKCGGFTYDSIHEMTYLHKVVAETLRKYPALPMLNRVCTQDVDIPTTNLSVKKGVDVVIPVLAIHRDPEIYPEPDKFDPERFNEDNIASRHPFAYLPFGEGPRICIGLRFGYMQSKVALVKILTNYRVGLAPNTPDPLTFEPGSITLAIKGGIDLTIEPR